MHTSMGRKVLMALTGLILVLFVMGHMLGNLLIFAGADAINAYAYKLHSMPKVLLNGIRLILLASVVVHIWMAVLLTIENKKAKPKANSKKAVKTTYAAQTMRMSGVILLSFIIFHILHFTVRVIPTMEYNDPVVFLNETNSPNSVALVQGGVPVLKNGQAVDTFNVYDMLVSGFKNPLVSFFYLLSTGLLCLHLAHGISSLFQTLGLRNRYWKGMLDKIALFYGLIVFIGFASIPVATLTGYLEPSNPSSDDQEVSFAPSNFTFEQLEN